MHSKKIVSIVQKTLKLKWDIRRLGVRDAMMHSIFCATLQNESRLRITVASSTTWIVAMDHSALFSKQMHRETIWIDVNLDGGRPFLGDGARGTLSITPFPSIHDAHLSQNSQETFECGLVVQRGSVGAPTP